MFSIIFVNSRQFVVNDRKRQYECETDVFDEWLIHRVPTLLLDKLHRRYFVFGCSGISVFELFCSPGVGKIFSPALLTENSVVQKLVRSAKPSEKRLKGMVGLHWKSHSFLFSMAKIVGSFYDSIIRTTFLA